MHKAGTGIGTARCGVVSGQRAKCGSLTTTAATMHHKSAVTAQMNQAHNTVIK